MTTIDNPKWDDYRAAPVGAVLTFEGYTYVKIDAEAEDGIWREKDDHTLHAGAWLLGHVTTAKLDSQLATTLSP